MPKQIKSDYEEIRIPFSKMSFTPDVPSTQLGPNEYNDGFNVESDVRGIRSVAGDQPILQNIPGTPTFITGGFRQGNEFWFIVATTEGYWYASNNNTSWYNITPGGGPIVGYNQATNITESWNGTSWTTTPATMGTARGGLAGSGTQTSALAFGAGTPGNATELYTGPSTTLNYKTLTTS